MLGARTFLRGLDYAKRGVVENVNVEPGEARGQVKGSDPDPYSVTITLTDEGITGNCSCPAHEKTKQHCKHIAALLISVRNQARANSPRPAAAPSTPAAQPAPAPAARSPPPAR